MLLLSLTTINISMQRSAKPTSVAWREGFPWKLFNRVVHASCLHDNNFRIICRSLELFACFDREVSAFFFKYSITTCKFTPLSIEYSRRLNAWLLKFKNEPAVFWPVGFLQIFLDEKIPRHSQLFSWAKTIDMKEKWDAKVFIFFSLIAAVPSPVVFV